MILMCYASKIYETYIADVYVSAWTWKRGCKAVPLSLSRGGPLRGVGLWRCMLRLDGHSDMPRNENEEIKQECGRGREETACVRHMATVTALGPDALVTLSMSKKAVL